MEWSIIIFCYNEEKSIGEVIQNTINFLNLDRYKNSEIIVVNDGSTDQTGKVIDSFINTFPLFITQHLITNQGIGNALNIGYDLASKDFVCAIPGDGQFDIEELSLVPTLKSKEFVTFYREEKKYNIYRNSLTLFNNWFNKWMLQIDIPDVNWIKVYHRYQIGREYRELNSSLVESEICAKLIKSGHQHIDLPSKYLDRRHGIPKGGNWRTLKMAICEVIYLYFIVLRFPSKF